MSPNTSGPGSVRSLVSSLKIQSTEIIKRIRQRFDNPSRRTMPGFLVGNVRSGTSMIVYHIARSWQVNLFNEDNPKAFELWRLRDFSVIDELLANSNARVTLFKPILDTYRTNVLLEKYPASKVLFAFRHYDDVVNSSRQRFYDSSGRFAPSKKVPDHDPRDPVTVWVSTDFAEYSDAPLRTETVEYIKNLWRPDLSQDSLIALRWLLTNQLYFDLNLSQSERVRLIHYESIVAEPEREFRKIYKFLELDFHSGVIEGVYSSSVGKNAQPDLSPEIRLECDQLFDRLTTLTQTSQSP